MNLATTYLGLPLRNPIIVGASPFSDDIHAACQLQDAGASALVQITVEELSNIRLIAKSTAGSQLKVNVVGWETAR